MLLFDQVSDAPGEHRGLARARTRNDQQRSVDMLDGLSLAVVGNEPRLFRNGRCGHWAENIREG